MRAAMVILLTGVPWAAATSFQDLFCPRCATFTNDGAVLDAQGRCGACGRPPVVVEAAERVWWGCGLDDAWLDQPCDRAAAAGCCRRWTATAFLEVPGQYAVYTSLCCPA